uniref:Tudor and KH domain containing-1 n=1 Tax=Dugesia japonica TaxID=6161 RepID=D5JG62_DUGJA|nr:tudor and KH domain containing-1 [Dugesia japonica]
MSDFKSVKVISVIARLFTLGASAVLWYWSYKYIFKEVDDDVECGVKSNEDYNDCYKIIRMKIPSYSKGAIIGKNGATIKKIQERTKTTIKFLNKNTKDMSDTNQNDSNCEWTVDVTKDKYDDAFDILLVRGLTLRVMEAEKEIKNVIDSVPIYSIETMCVDNRFVGKIIGKKGENIRRLKELYKIQIDIDKNNTNIQRQITFRGTTENINECKREIIKMIDSLVVKEKSLNSTSINRTNSGNCELNRSQSEKSEVISDSNDESLKNFVNYPEELDKNVDIYISSVVDCSKFYAHVVSDELTTLDQLIDEMTAHFSKISPNKSEIFKVGEIVAGFYEQGQLWQRVKIIGLEYGLYEIIYLDYGDTAKVTVENLRNFEINSKFLNLPFQAVRLMTHGIQPCGEFWTENDISEFEKLTKVGCFHKISAVFKKKSSCNLEVQLIDEEAGIDIANKLIADGKAKSL